MNERVVAKMTNFCVVKLSNSPAIACVPRLELDHFESQPDSPRIDQRLLNSISSALVFPRTAPSTVKFWIKVELL
jgi:hypothetical protein